MVQRRPRSVASHSLRISEGHWTIVLRCSNTTVAFACDMVQSHKIAESRRPRLLVIETCYICTQNLLGLNTRPFLNQLKLCLRSLGYCNCRAVMVEEAQAMTERAGKMLAYVQQNATEGDPISVIRAADEYGYKFEQMMHVGDLKGEIVREVVNELAPKVILELGTYFGYSAVLIASVMPEGSRLLTVEFNQKNADIAREFIKFAGVDDKVTLIAGDSERVVRRLREDYSVKTLDFVFLDHWKDVYKRDLLLLEEMHLLRKGTVILADNVIRPGAPAYLKYVETSEWYQTERKYAKFQYTEEDDALAKSVYFGP